MRMNLFAAAVAAACLAASTEAAKLGQSAAAPCSFIDVISSLELSQAEAETMTEAEIEARATVIAETYIDAMVEGQVSAEAKAEFVGKIVTALTDGLGKLAMMVLPAIAAVIGFKLLAPWTCQLLNGGMPCPFFSPAYVPPTSPPAAAKPAPAPAAAAPAAPAGPPAAAQIEASSEEDEIEESELAQLISESLYDYESSVYENGYAHL